MTHVFTIKGMTCNGCRTGVEKKLSELEEVQSATVSLENEMAIVVSSKNIALNYLRSVLSEKYTVTPMDMATSKTLEQSSGVFRSIKKEDDTASKISKLAQLKPLFLILGYIAIATLLLNYQDWATDQAMLDFMGLFYIVFSFFKMLDIKGFAGSFQMYDPLAKRSLVYGYIYPFIETVLGLMLLMRFQVEIALVVTVIILGVTTVGVSKTLIDKKTIQCACLGTALKLPMTEATFIENAIMIVMAGALLIQLL